VATDLFEYIGYEASSFPMSIEGGTNEESSSVLHRSGFGVMSLALGLSFKLVMTATERFTLSR
jgi:hypothetical protein